MKKTLLPVLIVLIWSCSRQAGSDPGAWLGGEIINPVTDYVVLLRENAVLDTIRLDARNRFLYRVDTVDKGIYSFVHNEYQNIFIEPGDSLMLRVNTVEFDHSLSFTGRGARRNNFLMRMFVHDEDESGRMPAYYRMDPETFLEKIDSMRSERYVILSDWARKNRPCEEFREVAEAGITYDYFLRRELYPFVHFGRDQRYLTDSLPKNYYSFRSEIDYGNQRLENYYSYVRFLRRHFDHLAYESYRDSMGHDKNSYLHNYLKLGIIDSLITIDTLKNDLLHTTAMRFLPKIKTVEENTDFTEAYTERSNNPSHIAEIRALSEAARQLLPGNPIPEMAVVNTRNEIRPLHGVITAPTVLYFWSNDFVKHHKDIHTKAGELKRKYPEFDFIALADDEDHDRWIQNIARNNYDGDFEYRFLSPGSARNQLIVIPYLNKAIVLSPDGTIVDGHANLFEVAFEEQLLSLISR